MGLEKRRSTWSEKITPKIEAGITATIMNPNSFKLKTSSELLSFLKIEKKPLKRFKISLKKYTIREKNVPKCKPIVNDKFGKGKFKRAGIRTRCPEELTGKNSVAP